MFGLEVSMQGCPPPHGTHFGNYRAAGIRKGFYPVASTEFDIQKVSYIGETSGLSGKIFIYFLVLKTESVFVDALTFFSLAQLILYLINKCYFTSCKLYYI